MTKSVTGNHLRLVCLSLVFGLSACSSGDDFRNSKLATEDRAIPGSFTKIDLRIPAELLVHKGDKQSVKIEMPESLLPSLTTETAGGELVIALNKHVNNVSRCKFEVTVPEIGGVAVDGAARVHVDEVKSPSFEVTVNGAGEIDAVGQCDDVQIKIAGAGKVDLKGLKCKKAAITIDGAGNCMVDASDAVGATINGTGTIKYKGSTAKISKSVNGVGTIEQM